MALNFTRLSLLKRFMSTSVNIKLVENLSKLPIARNLGDVNEILKSTPELNNYPPELWQKTHDFLKQEGFSSRSFPFIISQFPRILVTPHEKLFASINDWRAYQFGESDTITLLQRFPELLQMNHTKELVFKIETIKNYVGGLSQIIKLLQNSPTVLMESIPVINEKIEFFERVMRVEAAEVYKSEAMSCDLLTLKTRYMFLKRLGLFIPKKEKEIFANSKNPRLFQITDSSDRKFASKVCHVTLEEYEVFQEIYKRELNEALDDEASDDENYQDDLKDSVKVQMGYEKY